MKLSVKTLKGQIKIFKQSAVQLRSKTEHPADLVEYYNGQINMADNILDFINLYENEGESK